jgi:hypothetical protein
VCVLMTGRWHSLGGSTGAINHVLCYLVLLHRVQLLLTPTPTTTTREARGMGGHSSEGRRARSGRGVPQVGRHLVPRPCRSVCTLCAPCCPAHALAGHTTYCNLPAPGPCAVAGLGGLVGVGGACGAALRAVVSASHNHYKLRLLDRSIPGDGDTMDRLVQMVGLGGQINAIYGWVGAKLGLCCIVACLDRRCDMVAR